MEISIQEENAFNEIKVNACSAMTAKGSKCVRPVHIDGLCKQHYALMREEDAAIKESKPWNSDENPWSGQKLDVKFKRPGFIVRWCRPNKVGHRKTEGYTICRPSDYKMTGVDGMIMKNELVLMELPEHLAEGRAKYQKDLIQQRTHGARNIQINDSLKSATGLTDEMSNR
jgi:hypothetical protein